MTFVLNSKTALDMTKWGTPEGDERDSVSHHRDDRGQELGEWGERIVKSDAYASETGRNFNDHQV